MSEAFDVIVIGGGPGGYVCAIRAAQLGFDPPIFGSQHCAFGFDLARDALAKLGVSKQAFGFNGQDRRLQRVALLRTG